MSSNGAACQDLDHLFPPPAPPPSTLSPQRSPGASLESLAALQDALKGNHRRYHIFFNHLFFHNHITHRALAIYALGGSAAIIKHYYEQDGQAQRPVVASPEPITEQNFMDHLGDENFYQAYISFFSKQLSEKGAIRTLEEFVFSERYSFQEERDTDTQPEMLARLFAGLFHPLIHVGYGLEFGMKGMIVEGLAVTAVHPLRMRQTLPPSFFASSSANGVDLVADRLSSLALDAPAVVSTPVSKRGGVHAFDVVAFIMKDSRLNRRAPADIANRFAEVLAEYTPIVQEHAEKWTVDLSQPGEVERKMEEVVWLSSLLYGAGGSNGFKANFFMMHFVTSSLFLPAFIAYLSPRSQVLLLRGYLLTVLTLWNMWTRPVLDIKGVMATSLEPSIPITPAPKTPLSAETTPAPNPFLPILQSCITHPNDHVAKIQRAFAHFDTLYGRRQAGYFRGTELADADLLDGSLFLRAALLTADYVGWVREGKEARSFTRED